MKKLALFLALIMMCSAVLPLLSSCQNKGNDATADKPLSPPSLNIDPALEKDFYVQAEGEDIVIVGVKDDSIKELVIPEGVTVIGDSAFTGCDYLEKITIADSVKIIKQFAFSSCNRLKTVEIGENSQLTAIEEYAFDRLEHFCIPKQVRSISPKAFDRDFLVSLEVDKSNETYQTLDNSLYSKDGKTLHIFVNSQKTDSFSVPNGVVTIGFGAFAGDSRLTHIELPDSIQYIEESAFAGCESLQYHDDNGVEYLGNERCPRLALISYDPYSFSGLTEYVIPAETQAIMTDAFDGYYGGVDASVEQGNPYFKAVDGVIYSKDGTELVYHSRMSNTQFDIPNGVTTIRDYAFFATPNLKKLTMPSSVTHIGKYGLAYTSLETIQLSNNLTYIGDYAFAGCGITSIRIPDSVAYMGDRVFWNASNLQSVTLSASCSTITDSMFLQCTGLNEVVIPSNIRIIESYAFGYCENLTNVTVTEGVTEIRSGAFANCYSLESIHIPASVANINSRAFYQCNALKTIHVSSKNPYYSSKDGHLYSKDQTVFLLYARGNEAVQFTVPKTVTTIGTYAFEENQKLSSISLPKNLIHIEDYAFYRCAPLVSINFPDSLQTVGDYAFDGCTKLEDIILGNQLTTIGQRAFRECTSVKQVTFGKNVTAIGEGAFSGCSNLRVVTFGNNVKTIGDYAFANCLINKLTLPQSVTKIGDFAFQRCPLNSIAIPENVSYVNGSAFLGCPIYDVYLAETNPYFKIIDGDLYSSDGKTFLWYTPGHTKESFTLPDSVTTISTGAFYLNPLKTIVIPDGVTTIEDHAFYCCDHLESIIIPDSVTYLGVSAFSRCASLKSVVIGDGVPQIHYSTFISCTALESVVIGNSVNTISEYAFSGCGKLHTVVMGGNVSLVEMGAFIYCDNIRNVYYHGTADDWNQIAFHFFANDSTSITKSIRYYYSETQPSEEGNYWHYDENKKIVIW